MLWWQQTKALLWKCYIVRKRHPVTLAFELLLPLTLSTLLAFTFNSSLESIPPRPMNMSGLNEPTLVPPKIYPSPAYTFPDNIYREFKNRTPIMYAPQNKFTEQLMGQVRDIIHESAPRLKGSLTLLAYLNEDSMLEYYRNLTKSSFWWSTRRSSSLILFRQTNDNTSVQLLTELSYTLRPPEYSMPSVSQLYSSSAGGPRSPHRSYCDDEHRFIVYQALINEAFLRLKAKSLGKSAALTKWNAWRFPYPEHRQEKSNSQLNVHISHAVIFGFILTFPILVKRIAEEKVNKSREMFKMIGLADSVYWCTTFLSFFVLYLFQAAILTFLYTYTWQDKQSLLPGTETSIVLAIFLLYGTGMLTFGMFLSIPFTRPVLAVVVSVIIATITYYVPFGMLDPTVNRLIDQVETNVPRFLCCLFPNFSFATAISLIGRRQVYGMKASWSTLFDPDSSVCFGSLSLGWLMVMMVLQIPLYCFLVWYLDKTWPWQDGTPRPWCFPFQARYWKTVFNLKVKHIENKCQNTDRVSLGRHFERQLSGTANAISIRKLKKRFGDKMAVDGIDIDIKQGETTCLLGHNGAGKTTTMSMVTGIFQATEGTIIVNGFDVESNTSEARGSISLCPQHNVLYEELTVYEHLKLYAAIKGIPWPECGPLAVKQANVIQLGECLNKVPSRLSGGMKRKLCLGNALVGDTQLVILDEPTSGLDPEARRMIWDVLREVRRERTILLTTHYMEEADALADSIAIMTAGKISCHGTPMYLKKVFSAGYMFRIAKGLQYDGQALEALVRRHFPRGCIKSEIGTEVIFALESEDGHTDSSKLPGFFRHLEQLKSTLGVASFGLSLTTLEDVFLKVGEMETNNQEANRLETATTEDGTAHEHQPYDSQQQLEMDVHSSRPERVQGSALMLQRFKGLFLKRAHFGKRHWPMLATQMLIPAIVFGLTMMMSNSSLRKPDEQELAVTSVKQLYDQANGFLENTTKLEPFKSVGQKRGIKFRSVDTGVNVTEYLLGVEKQVGLNAYIRTNLFGVTINQTETAETYNLWYQYEAYHTLPAAVNLLYESRLNELTGADSWIHVLNRPMERVYYSDFSKVKICSESMKILLALALPFLAASYVLFPVQERASQSKLLQLMTGIPVWLFWLASFLFDFLSHTMTSILILIVVTIVDNNATFAHSSETIGILFSEMADLYKNIMWESLRNSRDSLILSIMKFPPMLCLTNGVTKVYQRGALLSLCGRMSSETLAEKCPSGGEILVCCPQYCKRTVNGREVDDCLKPLWSWSDQGILQEVTVLAVEFVFFGAILFVVEYGPGWIRGLIRTKTDSTISYNLQEDDVASEADRVASLADSNNQGDEALLVHNLKRSFGKSVAVNGLSFGVHKEEIFGLLGVNGAGKTTTFKMLTGDIVPTAGDARSGPLSIVDQRSEFQQQLGYCPQFDALLHKMTASEMLFLFGRLRGIPEYMLRREVDQLIAMSDLTKHAHKPTGTYSGGNKRKLSLAIALIGSPKLLLLDEPTAGVDPGARRKIWTTLSHEREHYRCSIILTSHSMEECEALCSRLAIMVKGQFRCFGPVQHLRNKYGQGYTVTIKIKRDRLESSHDVKQAIESSIRGAVIRDAHETVIGYHVTDTTVTWTELFENLERIKRDFDLEDYSVSDTTLEQIFIAFARDQQ
ncbi:Phospholipid-transporting ATPase ABCA3 [Halotydeus destructor]|nr:Phospholipid-transporting ATPase ABCA3 [Halotydeus destructor]